MCLRSVALALLFCLLTTNATLVFAQQAAPTDLRPPASSAAPLAPTPAPATNPNPFRATDAPTLPLGQPGFAEATDQNPSGPTTPENRLSSDRPSSPPPNNRRPIPTPVSTSRNANRNNSFSPRLARAAPIMGDSLSPSLAFLGTFDGGFDGGEGTTPEEITTLTEFPTGGGATRRKIAENTCAFPIDRLIFNYNSFQNALDSPGKATNIDRFTLGIEKTFLSNLLSIDVRLPLSAENDLVEPTVFSRNGSEVGNLSVALKVLLTSDQDSAVVAGLVVDTPTGGDIEATFSDFTTLEVKNEAVHVSPFLGFLFLQGGGFTHQGFIQVDVATNANSLEFSDLTPTSYSSKFHEQTLLYLDYSLSKSLYQAGRSARGRNALERISALAELHYTTALEDSEVIVADSTFTFSSAGNRIDIVNLTLGLDTLFASGTNIRFGTVVPLTDGDNRFFDIEFQAQLSMPL